MCDELPGCTHFSVTVGPDYPMGYEPRQFMPFRAELCGGPKISLQKVEGVNSFVGIRRRHARLIPPAEAAQDGEGMPDGPIEMSQLPPLPPPLGMPRLLALPVLRGHRLRSRTASPRAAGGGERSAAAAVRRDALRPAWSGQVFL